MNQLNLKNKIEPIIHVLFWVFIFTSINVDWTSDWLDKSIRMNTPAPLSVLILPIYFYINAFVLIPKYFSFEKWMSYLLFAFLVFIVPELLRVLAYIGLFPETDFMKELFSRDSFLFGAPSVFFIALNTSFVYRFTKDWFANKKKIKELEQASEQKPSATPYENTKLLSDEEAAVLAQAIEHQLGQEKVFLKSELTLRDLSEKVGSTEKKISYLLNQHLKTNFYELVNKHRVEQFKLEVAQPENHALSIVGIALNCGFPSKSSFYRAFKSYVGTSPSEYIKKIRKSQ